MLHFLCRFLSRAPFDGFDGLYRAGSARAPSLVSDRRSFIPYFRRHQPPCHDEPPLKVASSAFDRERNNIDGLAPARRASIR